MQAEPGDHAGVPLPPPLIFALPLVAGLLVHGAVPLHFLPGEWQLGPGVPVMALSFGLEAWAVRTLRRVGTDFDFRKPATMLVTTGPYRYTRNPMYLALALLYLGITLTFNALGALVLLPVALGLMQRGVIVREERYLARKFGDAYLRYKATVRRWL